MSALSSKRNEAQPRQIVAKSCRRTRNDGNETHYLFAPPPERSSNDLVKSETRTLGEVGDHIGKIVLTVGG